MKKMRRIAALFLALVLLAGCAAPASKSAPAETTAAETTAAAPETTKAPETTAAAPETTKAPETTAAAETEAVTAKEEETEAAEAAPETEAAAEAETEAESEAEPEAGSEAGSEAVPESEAKDPLSLSGVAAPKKPVSPDNWKILPEGLKAETEAGPDTVELRIPAGLAGLMDISAEGFEGADAESIVQNEDGSITVILPREEHEKMLAELKPEMDTALKELTEDESMGFTEVTANDDYTSFTVRTKSTSVGFMESLSLMMFYTYGGMYSLVSGGSLDNIHVDFVNDETGEIIGSEDSGNIEEYFTGLLAGAENLFSGDFSFGGEEAGTRTETDEGQSSMEDIEVVKEYTLSEEFDDSVNAWHVYVVKNNGSTAADILTNTIAYDAEGKVLGAADGSLGCLPPGCTAVFREYYDVESEIAKYEPQYFVSEPYGTPVMQDLALSQDLIKKGAVVHVTNNGELSADSVEVTALFFKDGELADFCTAFFNDNDGQVKPGATLSQQLTTDKEFDSVEVYLSSGQNYGW